MKKYLNQLLLVLVLMTNTVIAVNSTLCLCCGVYGILQLPKNTPVVEALTMGDNTIFGYYCCCPKCLACNKFYFNDESLNELLLSLPKQDRRQLVVDAIALLLSDLGEDTFEGIAEANGFDSSLSPHELAARLFDRDDCFRESIKDKHWGYRPGLVVVSSCHKELEKKKHSIV